MKKEVIFQPRKLPDFGKMFVEKQKKEKAAQNRKRHRSEMKEGLTGISTLVSKERKEAFDTKTTMRFGSLEGLGALVNANKKKANANTVLNQNGELSSSGVDSHSTTLFAAVGGVAAVAVAVVAYKLSRNRQSGSVDMAAEMETLPSVANL